MAYRSSASATSATGGTLTATPAGVTAGDYLQAAWSEALAVTTGVATVTTTSGWTQRMDLGGGQGGGGSMGVRIFDVDSYAAQTFSFTGSGADQVVLITAAWSGRNNSAPRTASASTPFTTQQTTPIAVSLTGVTAVLNDDIVAWSFVDQNAGPDRWSSSAIASYTQRQNTFALDFDSHVGLQTRDAVAAGATGSLSLTLTRTSGTDTSGRAGAVFAIAAAPAGGVPQSGPGLLGWFDLEQRADGWY